MKTNRLKAWPELQAIHSIRGTNRFKNGLSLIKALECETNASKLQVKVD
jgi:hypothetical protein